MGHFSTTETGVGQSLEAARESAVHNFLMEYGHRCDVRESKVVSHTRVPPKVAHEAKQGKFIRVSFHEDLSAPPETWLYQAEVEIHYHS